MSVFVGARNVDIFCNTSSIEGILLVLSQAKSINKHLATLQLKHAFIITPDLMEAQQAMLAAIEKLNQMMDKQHNAIKPATQRGTKC